MNKFIVSCIQNCASGSTDGSLEECTELTKQAIDSGAQLICLPEYLSHLHVDQDRIDIAAAEENSHPAIPLFSDLARSANCWILLGSIAVFDENGDTRNRSILINNEGEMHARYDKIHMFDVDISGDETFRESGIIKAGEKAVIADTAFAKLGLSVCYVLRFAALYRALAQAGAEVLTVPAAFVHTTGKAHWHVLLRSRAIETGCYVVAPCQYGVHGSARTYGHSLSIDPWGEIIAEASEDTADVISAELDLSKVTEARKRIPALQHDRKFEFEGSKNAV